MRPKAKEQICLEWNRTAGAHAGIAAEFGPWRFTIYAWQKSCYLVSLSNHETGEYRSFGNNQGELTTQREGRKIAEQWFDEIYAAERRLGIQRYW